MGPKILACLLSLACASAITGENGGTPNRSHALGRLAAAMKPGEWRELVTQGFDRELLHDTGKGGKPVGHHIFQYTNSIHWYPKTQELYFFGAGHMSKGKFIAYSAEKNAWRQLKMPERFEDREGGSYGGPNHGFESTTIDLEEGILIRQLSGEKKGAPRFDSYDIATGKWVEPMPSPRSKPWHAATEYLPEMKTYVRYEVAGAAPLRRWDRAAKKWASLPCSGVARVRRNMAPVIEYNSVHKLMLFGGGQESNQLYTLSADGKVKAIARPPFKTVDTNGAMTVVADPVSGDFLLYGKETKRSKERKFFAYSVESDKWRPIPGKVGMEQKKGNAVSASLVDHGVVLFCTYNPPKVWLYRHKPSGR
jgi:hypothetical protein